MARPPALTTVVQNFEAALNSATNLVAAIQPFCVRTQMFQQNPLHPNQARRVVALSFLAASSAWEEFVGAVFVRYVAGAKSPAGGGPQLWMGAAPSLEHAYRIVSGLPDFDPERQYLNWGPVEILRRVSLFFHANSTFERAISGARQQLADAAVIRNRVAHASHKARAEFIRTACRLLGRRRLIQGYGVGDLLLEPPPTNFHPHATGQNLFEAYVDLFRYLRRSLAP